MELQYYLDLIRRWFWLLMLCGILGGAFSLVSLSRQPSTYTSVSRISIGNTIQDTNQASELGALQPALQPVLRNYVELVLGSVQEKTLETLGFTAGSIDLEEVVSTRIVPNTTLLEISVTYTDPVLAADIANTLAEELIMASPSYLTDEQKLQLETARTQVEVLTAVLSGLQAQLNDLNGKIEVATRADDAPDEQLSKSFDLAWGAQGIRVDEKLSLITQRDNLIDQVNEITSNLLEFSQIITTLQNRITVLEIVEQATVADEPDTANTFTQTLLGVIVAIGLAFGVVLLLDYLNDTLQGPNDITALTNLPVLGSIAIVGKKTPRTERDYSKKLISEFRLGAKYIEDYYQLRANFSFASETKERKVFVVSSPLPSEGKSVVTANLAIALGRAGKQVLIVDADLRSPAQHIIWNLENSSGLSSLLRGQRMDEASSENFTTEFGSIQDHMQRTDFEGVHVLTSGFQPANPNEMLGSLLVSRWANDLKHSKAIDVVLFDTPPILAVSDGVVLARALGAGVILVVEANRTRPNALQQAMERFSSIQEQLVGVVLNKVKVEGNAYYGDRYYGHSGTDKRTGTNSPAQPKQPLEQPGQ